MRAGWCGVAAALLALAGGAAAQAPSPTAECANTLIVNRDACQKAVDLFKFVAPQYGTAVAGGSATMGQGGSLGGLPNFVLGVRLNAARGSIPRVERATPSATGAVSTSYETDQVALLAPAVDLSVGIFRGLAVGLTRVGGIDLLVNAAYVPELEYGDASLTVPGGPVEIGFGGRLGLLEETISVPGLAVTYFQRNMPTVELRATAGPYNLSITGLEVRTTAWRVTASKSVIAARVSVGVGQDTYSTSADVTANNPVLSSPGSGPFGVEQEVTRSSYFASIGVPLLPFTHLVGEIGRASGGETVQTFNQYDKAAHDPRLYGSVGIRVGF